MSNPIVSVLLPVFNGEQFLKQTIESVLNQTFVNFELIIIDDGSTDSSCQIIQSFDDQRIVFIENSENLKLIKTLNKGLELAKGKYLARIDADDYMHPTRLEKQVHFLDFHNEYILVGSSVQLVRDSVVDEGDIIKYYSDHDDIVFSMSFYCPFIHPSIMFRMDIVRDYQLKFDLAYLHAEDYEFWTRIVNFGKVANIPENLTFYRIHTAQISIIHEEFQIKQMQKIRCDFLRKKLPTFTEFEKELLFSHKHINTDLTLLFKTLKKFELNKSFEGDAKIRYIYKLSKKKILEINKLSLYDLLFFLKSKYFWKNKLTVKQKIAFLVKIFK